MELLELSTLVTKNPFNELALSLMWLAVYMVVPGVGIGLLSKHVIGLDRNKVMALAGVAASLGVVYWFKETFI
ncbi:hypothetical protein [Paenibacillus xylanexedens]|uniref:hypothetical protein n=1 Tax=Paenibacillus xylanexedens TaxID=528191 RepID=UPI0011A3542F|nr:hypothetical protein [Paenibacillus xylanexedens]